ncbi:hypothetical protein [Streptomyces sp. NPDC086989]|uniref:hypothetical protein n=1 Tax=Streptomyces sp. NPDC086989 TaxID=3365764 RepID=UPI00381FD66B
MDDRLRKLKDRLVTPSPDLRAALDAFDADREALVVTPPFERGHSTLLDRRCLGWRRPEWLRYEDKTIADSFWKRAGARLLPSTVSALTKECLAEAFEACDLGQDRRDPP